MFQADKTSNAEPCRASAVSAHSNFEFVSDFEFRASDFRRGFSFAEVLFAVAVLGIGFIMVAAIFPVAILQTQASMEQTVGTTIVRNGVDLVGASPLLRRDPATPPAFVPPTPVIVGAGTPPPGPRVFSFRDPRMTEAPAFTALQRANLWNSINANLINGDDPRFAFIPMYSRDNGSNYIRVICVAVRLRNREKLTTVVDAPSFDNPPPPGVEPIELDPIPVAVVLTNRDPSPDTIEIHPLTTTETNNNDLIAMTAPSAAREGAYIIISDDRVNDNNNLANVVTPFVNENGQNNGRVYRLGRSTAPGVWELSAEMDMASDVENLPRLPQQDVQNDKAIAFLIGAGYDNPPPGNPTPNITGANRAVQVFQNIVALKE